MQNELFGILDLVFNWRFSMKKESVKQKKMQFKYTIKENCNTGFFSIMKDCSLLYSTKGGNFTISLGGDWRFELNVDSNTGKCINFQGTLTGNIQEKNLKIPSYRKGDLFFCHEDELLIGSGCHYLCIDDHAYYDPIQKVLCVGNPSLNGVAIEFTDGTIAVICDNILVAIYLDLKDACKE